VDEATRIDPTDVGATTRLFQELWRERGARIGASFDVPPCPYTSDELAALHAAGRRPGFLPPELATQSSRHLLGRIFPLLRSYALFEHNPVTNLDNPSGWFDYDVAEDAPYGGTDEQGLVDTVASEGRWLASLNQYVVATQDSVVLTGRYLDERGTWSRFAHYVGGRMVCSRVDGAEPPAGTRTEEPLEGALLVAYDVGPGDRFDQLGGRSVGAPSAGRGLVDDPVDPVALSPEAIDDLPVGLDLDAERDRQAAVFVQLGFHTELGLDKAAYLASLPHFAPQPADYRGRLDVPLLVETRVSWERQADLADISRSYGSRTTEYTPIDARHAVPTGPYTAWVNWFGQRFPDPIAPDDARADLAPDELGATAYEMVALHLAHPVLNTTGRFLDAIGDETRTLKMFEGAATEDVRRNPGLCYWRGRAEVGANLHPTAFAMFRPLIRGTAITVGG
jgi:hypothetical protein